MYFWKAAVVVPLLQGLTKVQIAPHSQFAVKMDFPAGLLVPCSVRVRARITSAFRIPSAPHLWLELNREILNVAQATPRISLNPSSQICGTSGRAKREVILARTLSPSPLRRFSGPLGMVHRRPQQIVGEKCGLFPLPGGRPRSWRNLVGFVLLAACVWSAALAWGQEAREIGWEDLAGTLEFEDPFATLSRGQLLDLGVVARYRAHKARGEQVSDGAGKEMEEAAARLQGVDIDGLLARRSEIAELRRRRAAATNPELDGQLVRMPGYALPLDFAGRKVTEFLLVPWVGACIHTPPPPPNQILYVTVENPIEVESRFEPVWVEGVLKTGALARNLFLVDGSADIGVGYSISGAKVEEYSR